MTVDPAAEGRAPAGDDLNNVLGGLALAFGVASIPLVFCYVLGLPLGLAAIVLGALGRRRVSRGTATNGGQALAGMICGVVTVLLVVILVARPDS